MIDYAQDRTSQRIGVEVFYNKCNLFISAGIMHVSGPLERLDKMGHATSLLYLSCYNIIAMLITSGEFTLCYIIAFFVEVVCLLLSL